MAARPRVSPFEACCVSTEGQNSAIKSAELFFPAVFRSVPGGLGTICSFGKESRHVPQRYKAHIVTFGCLFMALCVVRAVCFH